mgnify:CR=1 FL=1
MSSIRESLNLITKKRDSVDKREFLRFIYASFKPKRGEHVLNESQLKDDDKELKRAYKTALTHYHPDKNSSNEFGLEWHFTAEHITKELNVNFERIKLIES